MISCSLRNETNSNLKHNVKCEHIASVLEFMSRREQFEKCFTLFNINQMDNNFVNYEMIKSNSIEFSSCQKNSETIFSLKILLQRKFMWAYIHLNQYLKH
jgi:hypothetical protein